MEHANTQVLIIGSGIAGLSAAIRLGSHIDVTIVTKGDITSCNTSIAQGGIAAAVQEEDSPFNHFQDTMSAGDYLCREEALKYMVEHGPKCVKELIDWGAQFDRETSSGQISLTREGAHRINRILHAHGDATGREIERTLINKTMQFERIKIYEQTECLDLVVENGSCIGAICLDVKRATLIQISAPVTIMATGGAGQLYMHTTNSNNATGEGMAMAYSAGAVLEDMEFVQFHPTSFNKEGAPNFLLSEAMRGEGGLLKNKFGTRFMLNYHTMAELAPRDIVSRAIYWELKKEKSDHVFLDMTHFKKSFLTKRFPNLYKQCLKWGVDMATEPIPVAPAAHYIMGGIKTDLDGRTNIEGLFACGESACTGVHGANRLASNSLLEGLVFGKRTGLHVLENLDKMKEAKKQPQPGKNYNSTDFRKYNPKLERILTNLKKTMWENVGIIRSEKSLRTARQKFLAWLEFVTQYNSLQAQHISKMLKTSLCITTAALERKGSRGGHYREDFPEKGNLGTRHIDIVRNKSGLPEVHWAD